MPNKQNPQLNTKRFILVAILFFISCDLRTDGYVESIGNGYQLYHGGRRVDLIDHRNGLLIKNIGGYNKDDSFLIVYRKAGEKNPGDSIEYWLAKTNMDRVYGPFNSMEIEGARLKYAVNPSLTLDLVKDSVAP